MDSISLLYIEDDHDIRAIYSDILKEYIEHIYYADDGKEGYARYREHQPDILLLDINMPKMDGLTLAEKIREEDKEVKIIITSSHGEQEKLLQAIELYLVKYLLKPIAPKSLREALSKAIEEITMLRQEQSTNNFILDDHTVWDLQEQKVIRNNEEVKLTKNERRLLSLLSSDRNRVFTFFEIFDHIAHDNYDKEYDPNQIRALVKLIRKKIPKDTIMNIYGEGYRFNPLN
ncbi:MAG TPA: response regulator transcription factor [Campylobacterales bacterium]|nr:response regulator transcription factor [Campylobacterales bacterium]